MIRICPEFLHSTAWFPSFPNLGAQIRQPNRNFAPQIGVAWDPTHNGKTVIRAGAGLYYENTIWNNVLFDRPTREATGAFLQVGAGCNGPGAPAAPSRSPADRLRFRMEFAATAQLPSRSAQLPTTSSTCCTPTNRRIHSLRLLRTAATSATSEPGLRNRHQHRSWHLRSGFPDSSLLPDERRIPAGNSSWHRFERRLRSQRRNSFTPRRRPESQRRHPLLQSQRSAGRNRQYIGSLRSVLSRRSSGSRWLLAP